MLTRDEICEKFLDACPFELYPVQEEALLAWFEAERGVLVCAPTGTGKTLIAEAAVFEALHTRKRLYYTTPLIALTEQKFRDLREKAVAWGFSAEDVGFITGNRRENPDALIRVVVAEILLNHLLTHDPAVADLEHVGAVVMDEFHSFNDPSRGVVWELSLTMLPRHVRALLLSATVGNPYDFADWLRSKHGLPLKVVLSNDRKVPLDYHWVEDRLLTELLPQMVTRDDDTNRSPALVFCFNRDECWEVAERLKGLPLINDATRKEIDAVLEQRRDDLAEGAGPKLRQMLLRGVGVHHAGVLPKHKDIVERLFLAKLVPFVVCTETLAAGVNLPARSVVLSTLLKGKRGDKKLVPPATAHQIFGRAGRPQFDQQGYVYAVAHDDDVKINKWKKKYDQIDPNSKDPGIMRARKDLERKRPTRRKTEQYWVEGHFKQLIEAGPAKLASRSMIPYSVLVFLLTQLGALHHVREFLSRRFATAEQIEKFSQQLDHMISNLAALGYLERAEDGDHVTLNDAIYRVLNFRSVDPLYGEFLASELRFSNFEEKILALESVLEMPPAIVRRMYMPDLPPGPLQSTVLEPLMVQMGVVIARPDGAPDEDEDFEGGFEDEEEPQPPTFAEMLKIKFEAQLAAPEPVFVQPKWVAGAATLEFDCEFFKFVGNRSLLKQEGLILRHLLRLAVLAGEFIVRTEDPDFQRLAQLVTRTCQRVDPQYTARFLSESESLKQLL